MYTLSNEEIQSIEAFVEKKQVHWYDLKCELVDHLASAVEAKIQADETKSFETALAEVYKSFGIFGFAKVVEERQKALQKSSRNLWYSELRSFFLLPRLLILITMLFVFYKAAIIYRDEFTILWVVQLSLILSLLVISGFLHWRQQAKAKEKLLLIQYGAHYYGTLCLAYSVTIDFMQESAIWFSISTTFGLLMLWCFHVVHRHVMDKARQLYPAVFSA